MSPAGTIPVSLNLNVRGISHSATLAINQRSLDLQATGRRIHRFGLGQSPFPVPNLVVEALRDHAAEKDYLPVAGLPALQAAVARFHRERDGANTDARGVLIGPGSKELMFLLQLCFHGDLVVTSPCWVSYSPQAHIIGRHVRPMMTRFEDRWRLSAMDLDALCAQDRGKPRLLILNYPGNPDGLSYTESELRDIAHVAREQGVIVLSDEIYGPLDYAGQHLSIARYYPEGTIISGGLSKWCGAGGWRLGTFAFPPELMWLHQAMSAVASETYTSVSAPIQHAAITAYGGGDEMERYLSASRRVLSTVSARCTQSLRGSGVRVHQPTGGFYLLFDAEPLRARLQRRGFSGGAALCAALLNETGVAILPGESFLRPASELSARLAFVDFDGGQALAAEQAGEALDEDFLTRHVGSVIQGIDRLADWLSA